MNHIFLDRADRNLPKLFEQEVTARSIVSIVPDETAFWGVKAVPAGALPEVVTTGDRFVLDFGQHCVGKLSFRFRHDRRFLDAPVRLRLREPQVQQREHRKKRVVRGTSAFKSLGEVFVACLRGLGFRAKLSGIATVKPTLHKEVTQSHRRDHTNSNRDLAMNEVRHNVRLHQVSRTHSVG